MKNTKVIADIFNAAKEKGLLDVSIRIHEGSTVDGKYAKCVLYVGRNDRWEAKDLDELLGALEEHKESLAWMNDVSMASEKQDKSLPIGLMPREVVRQNRFLAICEAFTRYYQAREKIPIEWIEEYNELLEFVKEK